MTGKLRKLKAEFDEAGAIAPCYHSQWVDAGLAAGILGMMPEDKRPTACIACGACMQMCPQHIAIPEKLSELSTILEGMPKWADISRQREEAAKRMRKA